MNNPLHEWDEGIVENDIAFILMPLLAAYRHNVDKMVQPMGISAGQTPLLVALRKRDGMLQKDLAAVLEVSAPSLAVMLARMEKAGMVRRRRQSRDHRTCRVYLTERGRLLAKKIDAVIRFVNRQNLVGFSEDEKRQTLLLLRRLRRNMERQREELFLMARDEKKRTEADGEVPL